MTDPTPNGRPGQLLTGLLISYACAGVALAQDPPPKPVRINDRLGPPSYLRFSGQHRFRVESLNGQFRSNASPSLPNGTRDNEDQLALRTILRMDYTREGWGAVLEGLDGRMQFTEHDSFANTTTVNTLDVLQANASYTFDNGHKVTIGRFTKDLGSRRLIARNVYRNTINSFNGVRWDYADDDSGYEAGAFWSLPTERRPASRAQLVDNEHDWDSQTGDYQFFGVHAQTHIDEGATGQVYLLGLDDMRGSSDNQLWTVGGRYHRPSQPGKVFAELEAAYQFGDRGAADVDAHFAHGSLGYQFEGDMKPRVRVAIDVASGDDANDSDYGRFNTLFGARRFEYGPTGIYGAIGRRNLISPELRFDFRPTGTTWVMVAVRDVRLHSGSDAWAEAGDRSGTGRHVGVQTECRLRWEPCPKNVRIEGGAAYFAGDEVRETSTSGRRSDTRYFFLETIFTF